VAAIRDRLPGPAEPDQHGQLPGPSGWSEPGPRRRRRPERTGV